MHCFDVIHFDKIHQHSVIEACSILETMNDKKEQNSKIWLSDIIMTGPDISMDGRHYFHLQRSFVSSASRLKSSVYSFLMSTRFDRIMNFGTANLVSIRLSWLACK